MNFTQAITGLITAATEAMPTWNSLQNLTLQTLKDLAAASESVTDFCDELKASEHWPKKADGTAEGEKAARATAAGLVLNRIKAAAAKYDVDSKGVMSLDDDGELKKKTRAPSTPEGDTAEGDTAEGDTAEGTEAIANAEILNKVKAQVVADVMQAIREEFDVAISSASKAKAKELATLLGKITVKVSDTVITD